MNGREAGPKKRTGGDVTADAVRFSRSSLAGRSVHQSLERYEWIAATALALALAVSRVPAAFSMHRPSFMWDEAAYLSLARYLAGAGSLFDVKIAPFGHPGYALLLSPAFGAQRPFETAFHLVLLTNLLLAAVTTVLAYAIARRVVSAPVPTALLGAAAVTAYPSLFVLPAFALSENVVVPLTLASVLLAFEALSRPRTLLPQVAFALCIVALWAAHPATAGTVLVALGVLVAAAATRKISPVAACVDLAIVLVGVALVSVGGASLAAAGWGAPAGTDLAAQLRSVATGEGIVHFFRLLSYQQAAVLVPSVGAYAIAIAVLARELLAARRLGISPRAAVAAFALFAAILTAVCSALFMASTPGGSGAPDVLFRTRYLEPTVAALLALGLPMFIEQSPPWRVICYGTAAALIALTLIADPAFQAVALAGSGTANALALSGYEELLHAPSFLFLGVLGLVDTSLIVLLRWLRAPLALVALVILWIAAAAAEFGNGIAWGQAQYDGLFGARTSSLVPYFAAVPDVRVVDYAADAVDPEIYSIEALALPRVRFRVSATSQSGDRGTELVVASRGRMPNEYHQVACENLAPVCLGVRDPETARRLSDLAQTGMLEERPALKLDRGLEIGVDHLADVATEGIWGLERTPEGTRFRWTTGAAVIILPKVLDGAPKSAELTVVAPDAGHITIDLQRPGGGTAGIIDGPDSPGENRLEVSLTPYLPGTRLTIHSTNRVNTGSDPRGPVSVQIRLLRLIP